MKHEQRLTTTVNGLLTNQCQHHAAGDVSDENYDQRRDYGERDTPLRVRRLLTGGGYYVEAYEGVETRRRAGENLRQGVKRFNFPSNGGASSSSIFRWQRRKNAFIG